MDGFKECDDSTFATCDDATAVRKEANEFLRAHLFRNGGRCTRDQAVAVVRAMCRPERLARLGAKRHAIGASGRLRRGDPCGSDYGDRYIRGEGCTKAEVEKLVVWGCKDVVRNFICTKGVLYDKSADLVLLSVESSKVRIADRGEKRRLDPLARMNVLSFLYAARNYVSINEIPGGHNSVKCVLRRLVKDGLADRIGRTQRAYTFCGSVNNEGTLEGCVLKAFRDLGSPATCNKVVELLGDKFSRNAVRAAVYRLGHEGVTTVHTRSVLATFKITEKGIAFYTSHLPKERKCQGMN